MKPLRRDVNRYVRTYQQSVPNEIEARIQPPGERHPPLWWSSRGRPRCVFSRAAVSRRQPGSASAASSTAVQQASFDASARLMSTPCQCCNPTWPVVPVQTCRGGPGLASRHARRGAGQAAPARGSGAVRVWMSGPCRRPPAAGVRSAGHGGVLGCSHAERSPLASHLGTTGAASGSCSGTPWR